jgi:C-terminal processing protease CtpA/Prc
LHWRRIVISSIQGPISRLGIRPGDVITHINGEAFHGNSEGLRFFLSKQRGNPVQIVVNAERGVAEALRLRSQCAIQRKDLSPDTTKYENHL